MARPTLYPRQLVMQVTDEQHDRVTRDAALREDGSRSAAARRLLVLGALLADALHDGTLDLAADPSKRHALADAARAVR